MLSQILIEQRKKKGVTQQQVSERLHISRQSISNWETGKNYPDVPTLIALSEYYDFSLDILKNEDQVKEEYEKMFARKEKFKYQLVMLVLLVIMLAPLLVLPFIDSNVVVKWIVVFSIGMTIPLTYFAYEMTKVFYKGVINEYSPLFVPKVFGFGITVNPYHKGAKFMYGVLLSILIIITIFIAIAPVSSMDFR